MNKYPTKQFIVGELNRSGLRFKESSEHISIVCPFHRDSDPSLSICLGSGKVPPGVFYCFSCSEKGTWNKLAQRLGLRPWGKSEDEKSLYIAKTHISIKDEIKKDNFSLKKWDSTWRRYSNEFLKQFKIKKMFDKINKIDYMYIPVEFGKEPYGYIRARLKKSDPGPKYFFAPKMTKVLYPIDVLLKQETPVIVLVEGVTDAYRLLKYKIPALSLLGVVITPIMKEQFELLEVKHIILCLDGDIAGKKAVNGEVINGKRKIGLKEELKNLGYKVTVVKIPKGHDPDSMPLKCIKKLRKLVLDRNGILFKSKEKK